MDASQGPNGTFRKFIEEKVMKYKEIEDKKKKHKNIKDVNSFINIPEDQVSDIKRYLSENTSLELPLSMEYFNDLLAEDMTTIRECFIKLRKYEKDEENKKLKLLSEFCEFCTNNVEKLIYAFLDSDFNGKYGRIIRNNKPGCIQIYNILKDIEVFVGDDLLYRGWLDCKRWLPKAYVMIFNRDKTFIALEPKRNPEKFHLPGGRMEMSDKSAMETAIREIKEELSIKDYQTEFDITSIIKDEYSFIIWSVENLDKVYSQIFVVVFERSADLENKSEEHTSIKLVPIDKIENTLEGGHAYNKNKSEYEEMLQKLLHEKE